MTKTPWKYAETRKFKNTAIESANQWKNMGYRTKIVQDKKAETFTVFTAYRKSNKKSAFLRDLDNAYARKNF
jgi:hypothetical protein